MRKQVKNATRQRTWLLVLISAIATTASAQIPANGSYGAAIHAAIREIAKDPCNSSGKFASLLPPIIEAAKRERAGTDDLTELLQRIADTGCRNAKVTVPKIELLLSAGKLGFLDACTYSPAKDYSVELDMARTHYHPLGVSISVHQYRDVPCMPDFIAALLTNQPVSRSAQVQPAAPAAPAPEPARRLR
jgi:hypothetical protein